MEKSRRILKGTFIQPWLIMDWDDQLYDRHINAYKSIGFDHIILQWSEFYDMSNGTRKTYYPSSLHGREIEKDLVGSLLVHSKDYGLKVYLGLNINDQWWEVISKTPAVLDRWLRDEFRESIKLVEDIWNKYKQFAAGCPEILAGWYIAFEVDNINFNSKEKQNIISKHYNMICNYIYQHTGLPVIISPFFNRALGMIYGPCAWERIWTNILRQCKIDIFALQDGIGCRREFGPFDDESREKAIKTVGKWFRATKKAIKKSGSKTELWSDLETFTEIVREGKNKFISAPVDRIAKQINAEAPYVEKFTSFSFQAYQDFDKDEELFNQYKEYVQNSLY